MADTVRDSVPGAAIPERSRPYQLEMYEASMAGNVIVVMDTGSGKTHVAVLRIKAEIERSPAPKIIWFLAPTVPLCEQQHSRLTEFIPDVQIRLLLGSDDVHLWRDQSIWDTVLANKRIVVSTYAILGDALTHGFIGMDRLSLLVFDEAHNCSLGHPANQIMKDHYHPLLKTTGPTAVPHILGLTACPITRSKADDFIIIERNLNAVCKTPRMHRRELLEHVHRPIFQKILYSPEGEPGTTSLLGSLRNVYSMALTRNSSEIFNREVFDKSRPERHLSSRDRSFNQLKKFFSKAHHIHEELGLWASNYYIQTSIERLKDTNCKKREGLFGNCDDENEFLLGLIEKVDNTDSDFTSSICGEMQVSQKVDALIQFFTRHEQVQHHGLVFVQQRATVAVLHELLSVHPRTKDILKCGTFIGTSNNTSKKRPIGDWLNISEQKNTLESFRKQEKSVIISTSVLEEGIDVPACNVVICFNKPANLKSFIQVRGRARKAESIFVLMLSSDDNPSIHHMWEDLERQMTEAYQKDAAKRLEIQQLEEEKEEDDGNFRYEVKSTRYICPSAETDRLSNMKTATLTLERAVSHIHHFCATLPQQPYVDLRPTFHYIEDFKDDLITAVITLPNCVEPSVRTASSSKKWRTERMANKDAAFQAYVALHKKGLVNDNLLPFFVQDEEIESVIETRDALQEVSETLDSWACIADCWTKPDVRLQRKLLVFDRPGQESLSMTITLPQEFPSFDSFPLYWDDKQTYTASLSEYAPTLIIDSIFLPVMRRVTYTILESTHSARMTDFSDNFIALFLPCIEERGLELWLEANEGEFSASQAPSKEPKMTYGLVRGPSLYGNYVFQEFLEEGNIKVVALPKRRDFLHCGYAKVEGPGNDARSSVKQTRIVPAESHNIRRLPLDLVECSLLLPSVMHHLWRYLLALDLNRSILLDAGFVNTEYLITATNASSANESTNYQRLEFIGDSVLKYSISVHMFTTYQHWPEGLLSKARDKVVANARLCRAAVDAGLDRYIVTEPFTAKKWSPPVINDYLKPITSNKRQLSTKVLADVVEALIGGAFLDGGIERAVICVNRFLPEISVIAPHQMLSKVIFAPNIPRSTQSAGDDFADLQRLIGYKFKNIGTLREALTHPSSEHDINTSSYQRLEFIGDAALDMIIVSYLVENAPRSSHVRMHLIKTAMVNAGFLAYICMGGTVEQVVTGVCQGFSPHHFKEYQSTRLVRLCQFMRHQHLDITRALNDCLERYHKMHVEISAALEHSHHYPWALLTSLEPEKFLSDIVESILGAILLDTEGDIGACTRFVEKLGLLTYLRRILDDDLDLIHPKTKLGEIAGDRKVEYVIAAGEESEGYCCTVKVGGDEVVRALNGSSKIEVQTRAADMAVELLSVRT